MYPDPELREAQLRALRRDEQKKAWSAAGKLLGGNNGSTSTQRAIVLEANFSDRPETYTLQFDAESPALAVGQTFRTFAEIIWSVEGNRVRRVVSVGRGTAVSGTGQGVYARVFDDSINGGGVEYAASVQCTRGIRANIQQPPQLFIDPSVIIAPAGQNTFSVPEDSGVVAAFVSFTPRNSADAAVANDECIIRFNSTTTLAVYGLESVGRWIPVPPGARTMVVENNRAAGDIDCNVTWGIEG